MTLIECNCLDSKKKKLSEKTFLSKNSLKKTMTVATLRNTSCHFGYNYVRTYGTKSPTNGACMSSTNQSSSSHRWLYRYQLGSGRTKVGQQCTPPPCQKLKFDSRSDIRIGGCTPSTHPLLRKFKVGFGSKRHWAVSLRTPSFPGKISIATLSATM